MEYDMMEVVAYSFLKKNVLGDHLIRVLGVYYEGMRISVDYKLDDGSGGLRHAMFTFGEEGDYRCHDYMPNDGFVDGTLLKSFDVNVD